MIVSFICLLRPSLGSDFGQLIWYNNGTTIVTPLLSDLYLLLIGEGL